MVLTHGKPLSPSGVLVQLHPNRGSFTGVVDNDDGPDLIGQISYNQGDRFARLSFFLPEDTLETRAFPIFLQGISALACEWGAFCLLGEAPETGLLFERLRQNGFSTYGYQTVWKAVKPSSEEPLAQSSWQSSGSGDFLTVKNLYQSLIPPLVQSIEPFPDHIPSGKVLRIKGEAVAWASINTGLEGVYVIPLLHPEVQDVQNELKILAMQIQRETRLPVYFAIRSYQTWLEPALESLDWKALPRQALMAERLAVVQKVPVSAARTVINDQWIEPTTPMVGYAAPGEKNGKEI
ncbi:MAG: hypothetical protein ABFD14_02485 [Anaerolineaceae bacterium]